MTPSVEVIGDDWIVNDGATRSTGLRTPNGAWDVMVIDEGVTASGREDWLKSLSWGVLVFDCIVELQPPCCRPVCASRRETKRESLTAYSLGLFLCLAMALLEVDTLRPLMSLSGVDGR